MIREKRTCLNPNHPFKQKWYYHHPRQNAHYLDNDLYCASCSSYINLLKTMLRAIIHPTPSLYGSTMIHTSKEQLVDLIDEVFDER